MREIFVLFLLVLNMAAIKGAAEFVAKANPGFLEIEGKGGVVTSDDYSQKDNKISGTFKVKADTFDTGLENRNEHMRAKYLEIPKYPDIIFKLDPVLMAAGTTKAFTGSLNLHGQSRKINGTVAFTSSNAIASFTVDVTNFGIEVPTYKLLTVGKNVDIKVTIPL
jgi:polyisoprenoid-binding protein YceI